MATSNAALYAEAYKDLNAEQKAAVNQLDGPLLVIAGPGTGKTQLLATRVGRILEQTDVSAENILCLTFSEAGARAMRQRLTSLIGMPARDITVSTYHGFGRTLIANFPERFSPETLAAQAADDLMLDKLMRQVQAELPYSNPLKSDFYLSDLKSLISGYKRALITPDLLEQAITNNQLFMNAANGLMHDIFLPDFRLSKSTIPLFELLLTNSANLPSSKIENIYPLKELWLEQLENALLQSSDMSKTIPLRIWKDKWLEKDGQGHFLVSSNNMLHKQQSLVDAYRLYNKYLTNQGLFDYDDMILLAIKGLEDNPDLKETLQERYLYIQLDEFQDTNEAQLRLVELLADHPVNERRPNILAVGDDDQAIYSFQGAHYSHMERFYHLYRDVKLIGLTKNYRSTAGIINLSDQIRAQINNGLNLTTKKQLSAVEEQDGEDIERVELPKDVEQLAWVSTFIARQIKESKLKASDIAVFAPKHNLLLELIPYLHAHGIAINYEKRNNVLDDPLINELLSAAHLAVNLNNAHTANRYWPQVLSHAYWELPTSLIWDISLQAHQTKTAWIDLLLANKITKNIALLFIRLNQIADDTSFELMLNYLIGNIELQINEPNLPAIKSPFFNFYFSGLNANNASFDTTSWQLLGQLSILIAKAKAANDQAINLAAFVDLCESYTEAKIGIVDNSPFREGEDAVNLMTAYASKGQEFEAVILINCINSVWGRSSRRQSSRITLPPNLAHVRINNNNDDEKLRLLFVATSRAKRKLIMTSFLESISGKVSEPLTYLNEHVRDKIPISPFLPDKFQQIEQPKLTSLKLENTVPTWWSRHLDNFKLDSKALLTDRLTNFYLSATSLNNFTNVMNGGPQQFFLDTILKFPTVQSPRAEYGSALHISLDWLFKQTRANKGLAPTLDLLLIEYERILKQRYLDKNDFKHLLKQGRDALSVYVSQVSQDISADDLSEQSFSISIGENNAIRLNGKIDRLIINKSERSIKIVDFKSGTSYNRWNKNDAKSFHHERQLYFYKLLIEQSAKFKGYTVSSARLQFVEPDENGLINNLELNFDSAYQAQLEHLINVVWQRIIHLDFPDTSSYSDNLSGIKAFEKDLLN